MRNSACIVGLCLVLLGCGKYATEYELDEKSFGKDTLAEIQKDTGLNFPPGTKGLKYHYIPPIDPIIFAKLEIPADAAKLMEGRVTALTNSTAMTSFPTNFANDRCLWWPASPGNVVVSNKVLNGYFIEAYVVREGEHFILYLKYFTI